MDIISKFLLPSLSSLSDPGALLCWCEFPLERESVCDDDRDETELTDSDILDTESREGEFNIDTEIDVRWAIDEILAGSLWCLAL